METTQDLIERAKARDLAAFGEVVRLHESAIRGYLAVRMNDRVEVDDLAQDVFITAFRRLDTYDLTKSFGGWLRGIAMNLLRNYRRKHVAIAVGAETELGAIIDARIEEKEESIGAGRIMEALRECLKPLGEKARKLLQWRYDDGQGVADIAQRLQCKHSAVTMMLFRIRNQLKHCVETRMAQDT